MIGPGCPYTWPLNLNFWGFWGPHCGKIWIFYKFATYWMHQFIIISDHAHYQNHLFHVWKYNSNNYSCTIRMKSVSKSVCKSICLSVLLLHNALSFSNIKSDVKRKVVIFTLLHVLSFKLLLPNHPLKVVPHSIFIPRAPSEPQNNKKLPLR